MHVLVTGGAGYIGSVIAARLLARGHAVTVYDDLSRGHRAAVPAGGERSSQGDIRDRAPRAGGAPRPALRRHRPHGRAGRGRRVGRAAGALPRRERERHGGRDRGGQGRRRRPPRLLLDGRRLRRAPARAHRRGRRARAHQPVRREQTRRRTPARSRRGDAGDLAFTALRYFNACGADGAARRGSRPRVAPHPPGAVGGQGRRRAARVRRRLPHSRRHLRARLRARRRPLRRPRPGAGGAARRPGSLQPGHRPRRLGELRARHRRPASPAGSCAARWWSDAPAIRRRSWPAGDGRRRAWAGARGAAWTTPSAMPGPGCRRIRRATRTSTGVDGESPPAA